MENLTHRLSRRRRRLEFLVLQQFVSHRSGRDPCEGQRRLKLRVGLSLRLHDAFDFLGELRSLFFGFVAVTERAWKLSRQRIPVRFSFRPVLTASRPQRKIVSALRAEPSQYLSAISAMNSRRSNPVSFRAASWIVAIVSSASVCSMVSSLRLNGKSNTLPLTQN
jgi:hypothetical protein